MKYSRSPSSVEAAFSLTLSLSLSYVSDTVFFAFWAVAGIASASAQIRKREVYFVSVENISNHSDERSADMMIYLGRDI